MPYDDIKDNFSLCPSDSGEVARAGRVFTYLASDKTGYCAQSSFSKEEIKETLESVGIKQDGLKLKVEIIQINSICRMMESYQVSMISKPQEMESMIVIGLEMDILKILNLF